MKCCRGCKIEKDPIEFHKNKWNKDGYHKYCKKCRTKESVEYRKKNSQTLKDKSRLYYKNNKIAFLEQCNRRYHENKDEINKKRRKRRLENHEKELAKQREYRKNNRERIKELDKGYALEKRYSKRIREKERERQKDPIYKITTILRKRLSSLIKRQGFNKSGSAIKDLGCTVEELFNHLESKFYSHPITGVLMSWENYGHGPGKWQADHIKAIRFFNISDREQFLEAFNFKNLQPLWYEDHVVKSNEERALAKILKGT